MDKAAVCKTVLWGFDSPYRLLNVSTITNWSKMPKEDLISLEGVVVRKLPGTEFKIELPSGHTVIGYLSGKTRRNYIRISQGDRVRVEVSPYDLSRGRIVYRLDK